jgi:beta-mannosidase
MKKYITILLAIPLFFSCSPQKESQIIEMSLNDNWSFSQAGKDNWHPATVPGCVHTDLLTNNLIQDPFYRMNEKDQQWIDKEDWIYKKSFMIDSAIYSMQKIELSFKGLDTYADVYLNDSLVLKAENMFREWKPEVKNHIKLGNNDLKIVFHSPIRIGIEKYDALGYIIPVSDNDQSENGGVGKKRVSVLTRKAGYHYGWDWGPRFVTSGIWRPVDLHAWNNAIIRDLFIRQNSLTSKKAELNARVIIEASEACRTNLALSINGKTAFQKKVNLKSGINNLQVPLTVENPELWWPNGFGKQTLYSIKAELDSRTQANQKMQSSATQIRIGLRKIELIQKPDSVGKSFGFRVNDKDIFVKGANYIPQDNFLNRVTPERYEHILQSAADAHMNMLRVWGGGIYENDLFYNLCDEKGLLVWQDFMFACAMFPGDDAFLANVKEEAKDNITRLRNHPSIALWCGNNECLSAWYQWGYKDSVPKQQGAAVADKIWKAYEDNFHHLLPSLIKELDPDREYWCSSPAAGFNVPSNWTSGDYHYWGVWWAKDPFSDYYKKIGRFMSEYGFQSFPEMKTVKYYTIPSDWNIYSDVMMAHQRSSIGNATIEEYMLRDYKKPKDFQSYLYLGQVLQAEGTKIAMEGHRRARPYCQGTMFWQIDDCWPVASWSTIDYFGRWKAQQYYAVKAYAPVLVSPVLDNGKLKVYICSDRFDAFEAKLSVQIKDMSGKEIWSKDQVLEVPENASKLLMEISESELTSKGDPAEMFAYTSLSENGKLISENLLLFKSPKEVKLPKTAIKVSVTDVGEGYKISLTSDKLALGTYLLNEESEGFFSDNYFSLLPGVEKEVIFKTKIKYPAFAKNLKIRDLTSTF